jgi:hypothetical protein
MSNELQNVSPRLLQGFDFMSLRQPGLSAELITACPRFQACSRRH